MGRGGGYDHIDVHDQDNRRQSRQVKADKQKAKCHRHTDSSYFSFGFSRIRRKRDNFVICSLFLLPAGAGKGTVTTRKRYRLGWSHVADIPPTSMYAYMNNMMNNDKANTLLAKYSVLPLACASGLFKKPQTHTR